MRFYWPIAKVDAERRMVWGYASTAAEDDQGEIVTREALAAALDDYMRFANIREMHRPSAVGVAKEAAVDNKGLYLGAKIVDAEAWAKVVEGVYNGFSIGGRVTARDPADRRVITGLCLTEISVVDRPANPEAVFDCWKFSNGPATAGRMANIAAAGRAPVQIWDCGLASHHHFAKAEAIGCIGRDQASIAKAADDSPNAAGSGAGDTAPTANDPALPTRLHAIIAELGCLVAALAAEASAESGDGGGMAAAGIAAMGVATLRKTAQPDLAPLTNDLAKLADAIVPRLDALQQRIEDIARTPLPPQTIARGFAAISKREDSGGPAHPAEDIVAALARMSEEERTLILIKAAHATPTTPRAIAR